MMKYLLSFFFFLMTMTISYASSSQEERAYLGGGCFWCMEALFQEQPGVKKVISGFAGGQKKDPSYEEVCHGDTGHAEIIEVLFDPKKISYPQILDFFWNAHDPTTLNAQGPDHGSQYRSIILTTSAQQAHEAHASLQAAQKEFAHPIVTEIKPLEHFYPAEQSHQNYYQYHQNAPYCKYVIAPKLKSLLKPPKES